MSRSGWHQDAVARLHEKLATIEADRLATQAIVAEHAAKVQSPPSQAPS